MLNQNLPNLPEPPHDTPKLSNPLQKVQISRPLCHIRNKYLEDFRSHKRNLFFRQKRLTAVNSLKAQEDTFGQGLSIVEFVSKCLEKTYTLNQMDELITSLYSPNHYRQHFAVIGVRKLLTIEENPPVQLFIDAEIIPKLIEFLGKEDQRQLQLEAAWALSNMASGAPEQTKAVVDNGAIPGLIKLLGSPDINMKAQAAFALGNIACDNTNYRDIVLQEGAVGPVIQIIEEALSERNLKLIIEGAWTLSVLCRKKPLPPYEAVKESLPILAEMIMSQTDVQILSDALWSLVNLSDREYDKTQEVFDAGVVPSIIRLGRHISASISAPCVRIIGNICSGSAENIDMLLEIDEGVLWELLKALSHKNIEMRKNAALALSNIAAGNENHKELIVGNAEYLDLLFLRGTSHLLGVRREIGRIFNNVMTDPTPEQVRVLMKEKNKILEYFGEMIGKSEDTDELEIGLKGYQKILKLGGAQVREELKLVKSSQKLRYYLSLLN